MNFLFDNLVVVIITLILIGLVVRYTIRSYYAEKRKHLVIMMRKTYSDVEPEESNISWKEKEK